VELEHQRSNGSEGIIRLRPLWVWRDRHVPLDEAQSFLSVRLNLDGQRRSLESGTPEVP
jgi:hypothetical protein